MLSEVASCNIYIYITYILSTTVVNKLFGMACPAIILMGLVQILVVNQNLYERNAYALNSYY